MAVTDGSRTDTVWSDAWYDVTPDGALLHRPGGVIGGSRQLVFLDAGYDLLEPWSDERRAFEAGLAVSRDGRRLAVGIVNANGLYETWISDVDPPRLTLFARQRGQDCDPALWHPDGDRLIYHCGDTDSRGLFMRSTERAGEGRVSPDGRWLAYSSNLSGRYEVYLRALADDGSVGREIPVTRDGCGGPVWFRGPDVAPLELGYNCQGKIWSVTITTAPSVRISRPKPIRDVTELIADVATPWDFLPDGRIIVAMKGEDEQAPTGINVVLDWTTELEARLAAGR